MFKNDYDILPRLKPWEYVISILNNNKINVINNDKLFLLNQKNIKSDTILQYNSIKNKYYLFIPIEKSSEKRSIFCFKQQRKPFTRLRSLKRCHGYFFS